MSTNAYENLLRTPYEWLVSICALVLAYTVFSIPYVFALDKHASYAMSILLLCLASIRFFEGMKIYRYRKQLLSLKAFSMGTADIPLSKKKLYLGKGFQWLPIHRQRLHLLSQVKHQDFLRHSKFYQYVQEQAIKYPKGLCALLTSLPCLPLKPLPEIGGKPWIHGVGTNKERNVYLEQGSRNSHVVVFGMTRVGKTRLMSNLVNQDIRNGEAVLVVDPKGDLELLQDMIMAAKVSKREKDLLVLHAGLPEVSAKYNPLSNFTNVSEVATRVAGAIQAEGEGKQFKDFAWKFLNIVATCLSEMGETINYASLSFYISRPKLLLSQYCEKKLADTDPDYQDKIEQILAENSNKIDKKGNKKNMNREEAVQVYVSEYIKKILEKGGREIYDAIICDLDYAASLGEEYYSKITASLGPVFDKINKTSAGEVFSWEDANGLPVITLDTVITDKKIVYIGLDSLSNSEMSNAVGQAIIADLVTLCGKLYKTEPDKKFPLCLHVDEFSNVVRDEFISLLNKAGGAGIKVTAYTQTVNDLGAVFGSNRDKMKMLLGNFGSTIMLRVANNDTAETFTLCLEEIKARSSTPSTMSNDRADVESGELFTTYNTDTISEEGKSIVQVNDLYSLPKGQAFVLTDGGTLYKVRIPLPKNDHNLPNDFYELLMQINRRENTDNHRLNINGDINENEN